jgi:ataxin-3
VFVVRRAGGGPEGMDMEMDEGAGWGDGGVGVLPECLADRMAVELGEPVGRTGASGAPGTLTSATGVGRELVDPECVCSVPGLSEL